VVVQVKVELVTDVEMEVEVEEPQLRIIQQVRTVEVVESPVVEVVEVVQALQQVVEEEVETEAEEKLGFILGKYLFLWV
jgi:hypothetical protein